MAIRKNHVGERFGRLTVVAFVGRNKTGTAKWLCKCDCGNVRIHVIADLHRGVASCGCLFREKTSARMREIKTTHGKTKSRLYAIWSSMKSRCSNPSCKTYDIYGGRGIKVCDEWKKNYPSFEKWMLEHGYDENAKRGECTLDRIDVNGDYEPKNCRIISQKEQCQNKQATIFKTFKGETKTISQWAELYGIKSSTLRDRLTYGWDFERCLTQPVRAR